MSMGMKNQLGVVSLLLIALVAKPVWASGTGGSPKTDGSGTGGSPSQSAPARQKVEFHFYVQNLKTTLGREADPIAIRLWIDANHNDHLEDNEELKVTSTNSPHEVVFVTDMPVDRIKNTAFFMKYMAPNTKAQLVVTSNGKKLYDSGRYETGDLTIDRLSGRLASGTGGAPLHDGSGTGGAPLLDGSGTGGAPVASAGETHGALWESCACVDEQGHCFSRLKAAQNHYINDWIGEKLQITCDEPTSSKTTVSLRSGEKLLESQAIATLVRPASSSAAR
ncbi:MAG: hypothetical protein ACXWP5_05225 [Bdellovibrionota bacterium]